MEIHYETLPVGEAGELVECTVVAFAPEEWSQRKALTMFAFERNIEIEFYPDNVLKGTFSEMQIIEKIQQGLLMIAKDLATGLPDIYKSTTD